MMESPKRLLIDELCFFNECGPGELEGILRQRRGENLMYIKSLPQLQTLRGYIVSADDLSFGNSKKLRAFRTHRCNATVEQFYFIRHRITLKYPYLPCIVMKGGQGHLYFYPIETLYISNDNNVLSTMIKCIDLNSDQ